LELFTELQRTGPETWVEVGLESCVAKNFPAMINLCGQLTLNELAEAIRCSAGFVGIESGPAHIANAFERPSVILMGRYRAFERYMPYTGFLRDHAAEMLIRWEGPAAEIHVAAVAERIRRVWKATPSAGNPRSSEERSW
jgi:heptosyltransferase-3